MSAKSGIVYRLMANGPSPSGPPNPSPCSINKDIQNQNSTPNANTNVTNTGTNVDSCGTPNAMEDDGTTLQLGKRRKFISEVWTHYCLQVRDSKEKAICKYYKEALGGESTNGTAHLRDHQDICPVRRHRNIVQDFSQKKLKVETSREKKGKVLLMNNVWDEEEVRKELSSMVIMHEYLLNIVEHVGFRRYSKALNSSFKMILRNTLKSDILKVFECEKSKTMRLLGSVIGKAAITMDMWTSQNQKRGFIAITTH